MEPTDILDYLHDPFDVRVSNASWGSNQTVETIRSHPYPSLLSKTKRFKKILTSEGQRLVRRFRENEEEARIEHLANFIVANKGPHFTLVYWAILIHFASCQVLLRGREIEDMAEISSAARYDLAFWESSTGEEDRHNFIEMNTCYHKFLMVIRLLICGIQHISSREYIIAAPIVAHALHVNSDLEKYDNSITKMSIDSELIRRIITKCVKGLSEELMATDLPTLDVTVCGILFDVVMEWLSHCRHPDTLSTCREILDTWVRRIKPGPDIYQEIEKFQLAMEKVDQKPEGSTCRKFKFSILSQPDDGPSLVKQWKEAVDTLKLN